MDEGRHDESQQSHQQKARPDFPFTDQVRVLRPQFMQAEARRASITRTDLANSLASTFSGRRIGIFREADELIAILLRSPYHERSDPDSIRDVQVFSSATGTFVPIRQVVSDFTLETEDPLLMRRNRQSTIMVHADPMKGLPRALFERVRPWIETISPPAGYQLEWGGEHEDSGRALAGTLGLIPLLFGAFFVAMAVTVMAGLLFATVLTLIVVPVLDVIFYGYRQSRNEPV